MIIKAAERIFNSDKICRSYSDLNFGVTFFGTGCTYSDQPGVRKLLLLLHTSVRGEGYTCGQLQCKLHDQYFYTGGCDNCDITNSLLAELSN